MHALPGEPGTPPSAEELRERELQERWLSAGWHRRVAARRAHAAAFQQRTREQWIRLLTALTRIRRQQEARRRAVEAAEAAGVELVEEDEPLPHPFWVGFPPGAQGPRGG